MLDVSVIIPYFNHGQYLQEAVASAVAATKLCTAEILIINDGSEEKHHMRYLCQAAEVHPSVRVIHQKNMGLSAARNKGIKEAQGTYIQFLDTDDILLADKVLLQKWHFEMRRSLLVSLCEYLYWDGQYTQHPVYSISEFSLNLETFLFLWERPYSVPIHTALFHHSIFENISFNEEMRAKEDWVFWCDVLDAYSGKIGVLPAYGAVYRLQSQSMTQNKVEMGRNWQKASHFLETKWGSRFPHLAIANQKWYQKRYAHGSS